jgi:hypothetical protein
VGFRGRQQKDGFQQVGFALRVVTLDNDSAGGQIHIKTPVVPEVGQAQMGDVQN